MDPIDRRALIVTGLAGATTAAVPALAGSADDAKLLQLCRNWQRLERALVFALNRESDALEAKQPYPPVPAILRDPLPLFPGFPDHDLTAVSGDRRSDGVPYIHRPLLAWVSKGQIHVEAHMVGGAENDYSLASIPAEARSEANRRLLALDLWEGLCQAIDAEVERWAATSKRIMERQSKLAAGIAEIPAHTLAGIKAKLAIATEDIEHCDDSGLAGSAIHDIMRLEDSSSPRA